MIALQVHRSEQVSILVVGTIELMKIDLLYRPLAQRFDLQKVEAVAGARLVNQNSD